MDYQNHAIEGGIAGALGQLGGTAAQAIQEQPGMALFRKYVAAKQEWDDACQDFARADQRKASAAKNLQELSAAVSESVQRNVADPTMPQAPTPNGAFQAYPGAR